MGLDKRIGDKFLHPGPGFGGSCFPKDNLELAATARALGSPIGLIEEVISFNKSRKKKMARKIILACGNNVKGKKIAILGLTFKPNTDDMRDSPSLDIIPALQKAGAKIQAYDPEGMDQAKSYLHGIKWCNNPYEALDGAEALVFLTEWNQFRALDLKRIKKTLKKPTIIDLRNIYVPGQMKKMGFKYISIGREAV
jgi:UDPglucose 6-dehydrogenase